MRIQDHDLFASQKCGRRELAGNTSFQSGNLPVSAQASVTASVGLIPEVPVVTVCND